MIGTSVEGPASFPFGAVLFGMTGLGLVGVAIFTAAVHYAIGALLPFVLALLLWKARRPAFSAQFTEKAIETSCPHLVLPYENLQGLAIKLRSQLPNRETPQFFPLQVFHAMGVLEIPSRLNVPSIEIYDFLRHRIPPGHAPEINLTLSDYLQRQEGMFGKDRVWSYGARQRLSRTQTNRQPRAVCLAMFLTGIVWMIVAAAGNGFFGWFVAGVLLVVFGGPFYLLFLLPPALPGGRIRNWHQASLVICPVGLAMVQGDMEGELRWNEVLNVELRSRAQGFHLTSETTRPGIVLSVEGARIVIADIYDRPLQDVYENILHYWREA